jgi:hypothetical protein
MKLDTLLVLGLGRVGHLFAKEAAPFFNDVYGTRRRPNNEYNNEYNNGPAATIREIEFDRQSILGLPHLSSCAHVLVTMPPPQACTETSDFLDELTERLHPHAWIGVLSTTSVYGEYQGAWITEESPCLCLPDSNGAAYLAWEEDWRRRGEAAGHSVRVFRCAGTTAYVRVSLTYLYLLPLPPCVENRLPKHPPLQSNHGLCPNPTFLALPHF